jgi:pilus assembly protein TadC
LAIPFNVLPEKTICSLASKLPSLGYWTIQKLPFIRKDLDSANIENFTAEEYGAIIFIVSFINSLLIGLILTLLNIALKLNIIFLVILISITIFIFSFISLVLYPKINAKKRIRDIDSNLIPALRHLLIEMKSGVTLFQSMRSVSREYGEVSKEFLKIVDSIETGMDESKALKEAGRKVPSQKFRKILWQIGNTLVTGADIVKELDDLVQELRRGHVEDIKKYTQELNPLTMLYMVIGIVLPALGISLINLFLSFLSINIPMIFIWLVPVFLAIFNIFFIYSIRSRIPMIY